MLSDLRCTFLALAACASAPSPTPSPAPQARERTWLEVESLPPVQANDLQSASVSASSEEDLEALIFPGPLQPGQPDPLSLVGSVDKASTKADLYYGQCAFHASSSRSRPWTCPDEQEPSTCGSPAPVEDGEDLLRIYKDLGWLDSAQTIYLLCLESCFKSSDCDPPVGSPPYQQGDLAVARCRDALDALTVGMSPEQRDEVRQRVRLLPIACRAGTTRDLQTNASLQRVTVWYQFPSSLTP